MKQVDQDQIVKANLIQVLEWIETNNDKFDYKHFSFCYEMNLFEITICIRREFSIYNFISNPSWFTGEFDEDEKSFEINEQIKEDDGLKTKMKIVFDLSNNTDVKQKLANLNGLYRHFQYEQQPKQAVFKQTNWNTFVKLINDQSLAKYLIVFDCELVNPSINIIDATYLWLTVNQATKAKKNQGGKK